MAHGDQRASLELLERQLRALGPQLATPDATGIATTVRRRIESGATPVDLTPVRERRPRSRLLVAAAIVLLLVIGATLAIGKTRNAVADWLGLRGVQVERSDEPVRGIGSDLRLGTRVNLAEARDALGFEPLVAARAQFGAPDAVYLANRPAGGRVTFLYEPGPALPAAAGSGVGMLITEFEATINEPVLRKTAGPGTTIEVLQVNGERAYWLEGEPHAVAFVDRDGTFFRDESRLAGNTLLFADGPRTIRIESGLPRDDVLAIAQSMTR